ncbi:MAG: PQQ-binding-like beta-propeller repeat protein [Labilithrix sp.]|nr:PQQ-binding-like beta-propeller repeat protein [Labilithrix sp.]MCW5817460.1 PQQ-binding-like beta-propeller repeat protein [Labilithrix sp.]
MPGLSRTSAPRELELGYRVALDDYPTAVAFSPTGDRLLVGTGGGELALFDAATGKETWRRSVHPGGVLSVSFGPRAIASSGQDGTARIVSPTGDVLHELPGVGSGWVEHIAWSHDGKLLAAASGKFVRIWHDDGSPLLETQPHASTVTALQWGRKRAELATSCYGGAYLWSIQSGANPRHLPFKGSLISLAWSPDERVIACGSQDCSVHFWRLDTGRDSEMTGYPFKPKALAWDARASMLATGGDATICIWEFSGKGPEGTRPIQLAAHEGQVSALTFHSRKALLASAGQDMGIIVWEPRRSTEPIAFSFLDDTPATLAWHPEREAVVTTDVSGNLASWRLPR